MFNELAGSIGTYKAQVYHCNQQKNETFFILMNLKCYFSHPKKINTLNFKEVL